MADTRPNGAAPIDEGDLLAFIEGETLQTTRVAAVQKALERDPVLARRVVGMRRDRLALRGFAEERAPAGLIAAVAAAAEPALERRMLLGLEHGRPLSDHPPVSVVRPVRRSIFETAFAGGRRWRLAAAAGLLLAVGAGAYLLVPAIGPSRLSSPMLADGGRAELPIEAPAAGAAADQPTPDEPDSPRRTLAANMPGETLPSPAGGAPEAGGVAIAEAPVEAAPGIDAREALRLASERRLVMIVRASDVERASERIERVALRADGVGRSWRVAPHVPSAVLAALSRRPVDTYTPAPQSPLPPDTFVAMSDAPAHAPLMQYLPLRNPARKIAEPSASAGVYVIESRLDEAGLEAVRAALTSSGVELRFEALDEPLPDDGEVLHPGAVLWWDLPASAWTRWATIPVVVEQAD